MRALLRACGLLLCSLVVSQAQAADSNLTENADSPEIQWTAVSGVSPDLRNRAAALTSPVAIFEFLRNNYDFTLYQGARSGSTNTYLGGKGNDVDLAATLIAMLRSQGIPARYAVGTVRMPTYKVMNWLQVENAALAQAMLQDEGIQKVAASTVNNVATLDFEHVWVEALIPTDEYRGTGTSPAPSACSATTIPATCHWVPLDPSFKQYQQRNSGIDPFASLSFDYTSYYNAIKNNDASRRDKNPLEIYQEQVLNWLRTSYAGKTLQDIPDFTGIAVESNALLPESLPYTLVNARRTYNSAADHDAVVPGTEAKKWMKYVTATPYFNGSPSPFGGVKIDLVSASTKRFTYSATQSKNSDGTTTTTQAFYLDGVVKGTALTAKTGSGGLVINGETITQGAPLVLLVQMDGAPGVGAAPDQVITASYNGVFGGYYLVATGGETSNWSQVHRAAQQLLQANQQYPVTVDGSGEPFVNGARLVDPSNSKALDALTGGLLYVAGTQYFAKLKDSLSTADRINKVKSPIAGFLGVVSSTFDAQYINGTAFSILPNGLLIDMKGITLAGNWRITSAAVPSNPQFKLLGHIMSSLEHETWQALTGYDAISTVRGIQLALTSGASLLDLKYNSSTDNVQTMYAPMGYASAAPSGFTLNQRAIYSTKMDSWAYSTTDGTQVFPLVEKKPSSATDSRRPIFAYANNYFDGNLNCFYTNQNQLQALKNQYGGSAQLNAGHLCISSYPQGETVDQAIQLNQSDYSTYRTSYIGAAAFDYLDESQSPGFSTANFAFGPISTATGVTHPWSSVQRWRDTLYLQDLTKVSAEVVVPSTLTVGPYYRFSVDVLNGFDPNSNLTQSTYEILNEYGVAAGGGYVDGTQTISQSSSIELSGSSPLPTYNNSTLTDKNTIGETNNNLIKTPSTNDPASTVTGNNYHDETDLVIRGRGLNYVFTRTYNSAPASTAQDGPLGYGWTHSYAMHLKSNDYGKCPNCTSAQAAENGNSKTSSISYTDERGGEHLYLVDESSFAVTPPQGEFDTLSLDSPSVGQYTLTFRNGTKYVFQIASSGSLKTTPGLTARLLQIADPFGNQLNFGYDSQGRLATVADNLALSGRTGLVFAYASSTSPHLTSVTDWTARVWKYSVDGNGNLVSYISPQPPSGSLPSTAYGYTAGTHNLISASKPLKRNGVTVQTAYSYYRNGRTFNDTDGLGDAETLDYDLFRNTTSVTDPRGNIRAYEYDSSGRMTKLIEPDGGVLFFSNGPDGLRYKKTDGLGYATQYSYKTDGTLNTASDTGGNVTREMDALSQSVYTTYGIYDQVATVKDKRGITRTVTYPASDGSCNVSGKLGSVSINRLTDAYGNLSSNVTLATYCWNSDGTPKSQTEYLDSGAPSHTRVTTFYYTDATHLNIDHVTAIGWDGASVTRSYTYDGPLFRKKTETLKRRNTPTDATLVSLTTTYTYDALDRVTQTQDAVGDLSISRYDDNGQTWQVTIQYKKPDGTFDTRNVVTRTFDGADRVATETDALNGVTTYQYDTASNVVAVTDADKHTTRYEYDSMNRRTAVVDANGNRTTTTYNLRGDVIAVTNAMKESTGFAFDAIGRRTSVTDPHGFVTALSYDVNNNVTCTIDPNYAVGVYAKNSDGCGESRKYDELNRVMLVRDGLNGTTTTTYNLLGNPVAQVDAEGRKYTWAYDGLGRLVAETDFTGKTIQYKVDEAGNVWQRTNRLNEITQYTYDYLNRNTLVSYQKDGTSESFSYDPAGNLGSAGNALVSYTLAYDNLNRLKSKTDSRGKSLSFTYDPAGNILTKTTYQGSTTNYVYDGANRLVALTNPDYYSVDYQYDAAGRLLSRVVGGGATSVYGYDGHGWMTSMKHYDATNALVFSATYGRDKLGHISSINNPAYTGPTTYGLDGLYRLATVTAASTANSEAFSYDHIGNRITATRGGNQVGASGSTTNYYLYYPATQTGTLGGSPGYTATNNNRLKEIHIGSTTGTLDSSFAYDDEGRSLTRSGSGNPMGMTWDPKGRLATLTQGGYTEQYGYDPMDYRIQRSSGRVGALSYYLEGDRLESVYSGSTLKEKYFRGSSIDELVAGYTDATGTLTPYQFEHDQVMSVPVATKPNGGKQESFLYWAFGETQSSTGTQISRLKYTGREDDGTGLYQYRARYYDPSLGRFISEDPKKFSAGINFYAYVGNDPVDNNDPSGMDCTSAGGMTTCIYPGGPAFSVPTPANFPSSITSDQLLYHAYDVTRSINGRDPSDIERALMNNPTPGNPMPASWNGTPNNAVVIPGVDNPVTSYLTNDLNTGAPVIVNITGDDSQFSPGYVARTVTDGVAHTYGEGLNWQQSPLVAGVAGAAVGMAGIGIAVQDAANDYVWGTQMDSLISSSPPAGNATPTSMPNFSFDPGGFADGGFLLYPNKPNNNQIQSVYKKGP